MSALEAAVRELEIAVLGEGNPTLLLLVDHTCFAIALGTLKGQLVVAVPGSMQLRGSSDPVELPPASEGSWDLDSNAMGISIRFYHVDGDSVMTAVDHIDFVNADPADMVTFVAETWIVPALPTLEEAYNAYVAGLARPAASSRVRRAPPAGGRGGKVKTVKDLQSSVEARMAELESRIARTEGQVAQQPQSEPAAAQLHGHGILGVQPPGAGRGTALAEARSLLGVGGGARVAPLLPAQPVPPPPGLGERMPIAGHLATPATADIQGHPEADSGDALLLRLVRALEGKQSHSQPLGPAFGLPAEAATSVEEYGAGMGPLLAGSEGSRGTPLTLGGKISMERLVATRRAHPEVVIRANDRAIQESLGAYAGEAWAYQRHARQCLVPECGNWATLKRLLVAVAAAIDEGRVRGPLHQHAMMIHIYRVLESTALSSGDSAYAWPLLGLDDPAGRPAPGLAPIEAAGLAAYHKEQAALEAARAGASSKRQPASPHLGEEEDDGGKGKGRRAKAKAKAKAKAEANAFTSE